MRGRARRTALALALVLVAVALIAAFTLSRCADSVLAPEAVRQADGTVVRTLWVPGPQFIAQWLIPDDEKCVVGFTHGGGERRGESQATVYSVEGKVLATRDFVGRTSALAHRSDQILATSFDGPALLSLPDLADVRTAPGEQGLFFALSVERATDPLGGWIAIERHPQGKDCHLLRVAEDSLRVSEGPRVRFPLPKCITCVPGSGEVIAVTDHEAAVIDPSSGEVRRRVSLPCEQAGFDLVATPDRAWIATRDGSGAIVELPLATADPPVLVPTGASGRTHLALDSRGSRLGVVVESLTKGRDPSGTCVLLYAVGPSGLREEGRTEVESQGFVNDTGVIGSRRAVLVGGYAGSARIVEFPEVTTAPPAPSPR